jgi:indolepyruvate ferredoxin oxidoreductase
VGTVVGRFQMGGEGAMWNGMAPFVKSTHFIQNIGDGTLAHSGTLAIRASVASRVNITYKLLVNSTVAMTGGQPIAGGRDVANLARQLLAEGVRRIIVTTDDPRRERAKGLPSGVDVWPRRRIVEAQRILASTPGVTVLMHDQECAAELRRKRKRGLAPTPRERVHVNTRLCESCGDCGAVSNCLSVRSVETPFGPKTQIHQESCNLDFSCLGGHCPAMVTVRASSRSGPRGRRPAVAIGELAEPVRLFDPASFTMRLVGIGGTGVLTVAQIVAMAGHLEGRYVRELDQTGIAQKGGAVVSDIRLDTSPRETTPRLGEADCDLYLGCDALAAATAQYLTAAAPGRTVAVTSTTIVPTGRQVADRDVPRPSLNEMRERIDERTRSERNVWIDAQRIAREQLGSDTYANVVLLGAAYQIGAVPLSAACLERAIELNGVDVEQNRQAFRLGRRSVIDPNDPPVDALDAVAHRRDPRLDALVESIGATTGGELDALVRTRVADLVDYQEIGYARQYAETVGRARDAEKRLGHPEGPFTRAVAVELHRLMAYKDEYEVARLHLATDAQADIDRTFGAGGRVTFHLQPPALSSFGLARKLRLRASARIGFRLLRALRWLRGTALDPFGGATLRRQERALRDEYTAAINDLSDSLTPEGYARAIEVAGLPSVIRGFGDVKVGSIQRYRERQAAVSVPVA